MKACNKINIAQVFTGYQNSKGNHEKGEFQEIKGTAPGLRNGMILYPDIG